MTPAVGWTEHDYYRASRAARQACERKAAQLQIRGVLEEVDAALWGAGGTSISSSPPLDAAGLFTAAVSPGGGLDTTTHEGPDATPDRIARRGQEGA